MKKIRNKIMLAVISVTIVAIIGMYAAGWIYNYSNSSEIDRKISKIAKNVKPDKTPEDYVDFKQYSIGQDSTYGAENIEFGGKKYDNIFKTVDNKYLNEELESRELDYIYTKYGKDNEVKENIKIFSLKDLSENIFIAVKYENSDEYLLYCSYENKWMTFNDFLNDINPDDGTEDMKVNLLVKDGNGYSDDDYCEIVYRENILDYFLKEIKKLSDAGISTESQYKGTGLSFRIALRSINAPIAFYVLENGDISYESVFGTGIIRSGDKGMEFAMNFMDYLKDNGEGYVTSYDEGEKYDRYKYDRESSGVPAVIYAVIIVLAFAAIFVTVTRILKNWQIK